MRYLLDTHTLLWVLFEPDNISKKAKNIITDIQKEVYVSLISFWEISLKYNTGKLQLTNITPDELPDAVKDAGFDIFHLNEYDVSSFYKLPIYSHKDPFDRLFIWQAIQNNLTILSKDKHFKEYKNMGLKISW